MSGDVKSSQVALLPLRLMRVFFGATLLGALFVFLGSTGASAASDSNSSASPTPAGQESGHATKVTPGSGKGLLSGVLAPVAAVVDKAVSQIPVVKDVTGTGTVSKVVAPVSALTDTVENTATSIPAVGHVVSPVRAVTNTVLPPVLNGVGAATTPVLAVVDEVTAPLVKEISPVVDPVTGVLAPVVGGATDAVVPVVDGATGVVDQLLPPGNSGSGNPGTPGTGSPGTGAPGTETPGPGTPGTGAPDGGMPGSGAPSGLSPVGAAPALPAPPSPSSSGHSSANAAVNKAVPVNALFDGAQGSGTVTGRTLAESLAALANNGALETGSSTMHPAAGHGQNFAGAGSICSADLTGFAGAPCQPATPSGTGISAGSGISGTGSGSGAGSGGSNGSWASAQENFAGHFSVAVLGTTLRDSDWPMPASLPANPGATPG